MKFKVEKWNMVKHEVWASIPSPLIAISTRYSDDDARGIPPIAFVGFGEDGRSRLICLGEISRFGTTGYVK